MKDWVQIARECVVSGGRDLYSRLPNAIKAIIDDNLWQGHLDEKGTEYKNFPSFIQGELDLVWTDLRLFCKSDPDCVRMLDELVEPAAKQGRPEKGKGNNIPFVQRGTSATHALRRLKRDNPELAERVINGEISANAAAIEAGFRRKMKSIPVDSVDNAVTAVVKHFGIDLVRDALARQQ